jgi:hypothetical protein
MEKLPQILLSRVTRRKESQKIGFALLLSVVSILALEGATGEARWHWRRAEAAA